MIVTKEKLSTRIRQVAVRIAQAEALVNSEAQPSKSTWDAYSFAWEDLEVMLAEVDDAEF